MLTVSSPVSTAIETIALDLSATSRAPLYIVYKNSTDRCYRYDNVTTNGVIHALLNSGSVGSAVARIKALSSTPESATVSIDAMLNFYAEAYRYSDVHERGRRPRRIVKPMEDFNAPLALS